jgi:hypothetical protein
MSSLLSSTISQIYIAASTSPEPPLPRGTAPDLITTAGPSSEPPFLAAPRQTSSPLQALVGAALPRWTHPPSPCGKLRSSPASTVHRLVVTICITGIMCIALWLPSAPPCGYYQHRRHQSFRRHEIMVICAMPVSRSAAHTCSRRCEIIVFEIIYANLIRNLFIVHRRSPDPVVGFVVMTTCQVCGSIDCSSGTASGIVFSIDMRPKFINSMVITIILLLILFAPLHPCDYIYSAVTYVLHYLCLCKLSLAIHGFYLMMLYKIKDMYNIWRMKKYTNFK